MPFLIPLAGLALGALGKLISNRRSIQALGNATATAGASTPSETGLSTAATSGNAGPSHGIATSSTASQDPGQQVSAASSDPRNRRDISAPNRGAGVGTNAIQPATGPVQQNKGPNVTISQVEQGTSQIGQTSGGDAGLAGRLGRESIERSKKRNKEQQASISNAALS